MRPDDEGRTTGPPFDENVVPTPPSTPAPNNTSRQSQSNGNGRPCPCNTPPPKGRYDGPYDPWRAGFRRGAIDALRLAARRIDDPHVWMVLSELTESYETESWRLAG